jgi:GNAT superfamily N-acetyltransferase
MAHASWIEDLALDEKLAGPRDNVRLPEAVVSRFGAAPILSRFFIAADNMARAVGIDLKFRTDFHALMRINALATERGSWYKMPDVFDPAVAVDLDASNSFWIAAENPAGEVVATTCGRIYDWTASSLGDQVRLAYYGGREVGQRCIVTAPLAAEITGHVYYAGGVWVAPEYRSAGLSSLLPHAARAYAIGRWPVSCAMNLTSVKLVEKGLPARYGYTEVSRSVFMPGSPLGDLELAVCRLKTVDMYADFLKFTADWRDYVRVKSAA